MAQSVSLLITVSNADNKKKEFTVPYINPDVENAKLIAFAEATAALTSYTFYEVKKEITETIG